MGTTEAATAAGSPHNGQLIDQCRLLREARLLIRREIG